MLPREVAHDLLHACRAAYRSAPAPMTFANVDPDRTFMRRVTELTAPLWERYLRPLVPHHRVAFTTCVVKHPDPGSHMDAHEDGTFVDERRHRSMTLWMALTDCTPEQRNGMIAVLPRSHRVATHSAGANVPEWHRDHTQHLTRHLVPVPTLAGEAVLWDSRLLHGSPPNLSTEPRFAIVAELVPADAPLVHVEALGRRRRRAFAVDEAFHLEHSPIAVRHQMPDRPVLRRFEELPTSVTTEVVADLCGGSAPTGREVPRPDDDWYPPSAGAAPPPRVHPVETDPLGGSCEDLCEAMVIGLRSRLAAGWTGVGRTAPAFAAARDSGSWGVTELSTGGRTTPAGTAVLGGAGPPVLGSGVDVVGLVALEPGAAWSPEPAAGRPPDLLVPLVTPGGPAGVATAGGAERLELGVPIWVASDTPYQLWNQSGELVRTLVVRHARGRRRGRLVRTRGR